MSSTPESEERRRAAGEAASADGAAGAPRDEIEDAVLARCRTGDRDAFRLFVVRYEARVFALLSRVLGRGPHVDDLAQETFLRAYRALPSFEPHGAARVSTWLLTIATRLALDAKKRRVPIDFGVLPEQLDEVEAGTDPESIFASRQLGRDIERAAEALSLELRAVLVLSDLHGFSMREIADALGIPENTVKTRLFRARERMREALRPAWRNES